MITSIDLKEIRPISSDLDELELLVKQLVARPFLAFRVSYGDELRLHLGPARPRRNPKLKSLPSGSFVIGSRASSWILQSGPTSTLLTSGNWTTMEGSLGTLRRDIKSIESIPTVSPGAIVILAKPHLSAGRFVLSLAFSDGSMFFVTSSDEVEDGEKVADWEILFTPQSRHLSVGPGARWSYVDSTAPEGGSA